MLQRAFPDYIRARDYKESLTARRRRRRRRRRKRRCGSKTRRTRTRKKRWGRKWQGRMK